MKAWRSLRRLRTAALMAVISSAHADAHAAPPPIADFFRKPLIGEPVLSPDGRMLAAVTTQDEGHGRLAVIDLVHPDKSQILVQVSGEDVISPRWVNDHRLVYSVAPKAGHLYDGHGPGLWAVDVDAPGISELISPDSWGGRGKSGGWYLYSPVRDGSDDVIIARDYYRASGEFVRLDTQRLNTRTGHTSNVLAHPPEHTNEVWLDDAGLVFALSTYFNNRLTVQVPQGDGWHVINQSDAFTGEGRSVPMRTSGVGKLWMVGPDPARQTDTMVLQQLDLQHPERGEQVLLSLPGYDFAGSLVVDRKLRKLIGIRYETDAEGTVWLDPSMRALQADIDAKLPGLVNQIVCSSCLSDSMLLVSSSSDHQPPALFRYDRADQSLTLFFQSRPWIDASQQGRREFTNFKARDGMTIPVLVTLPPGAFAKNLPAVMLVHGGPWVRNARWAWEPMAQLLASRGYVVIEPEFRGSAGYGGGLFRAGFKQWGLAMQDDVSDAMDWAASKGWIDRKRVCIGGASYGGYAVLMGLAKEPERYRCGFEWSGVSDINLMYDITWSDASAANKTYGMPVMIGDQDKDAAQLKATSPLKQAAKINKPVLMGYGGLDPRVPYKHGKAMQSALEDAGNKNVEWVFYPDEGHGWTKLEDNVDWWGRVEKFLAKNTAPQ